MLQTIVYNRLQLITNLLLRYFRMIFYSLQNGGWFDCYILCIKNFNGEIAKISPLILLCIQFMFFYTNSQLKEDNYY